MIVLKKLDLFQIKIPLIRPFQTSFGTQTDKEGILLKLTTSTGEFGWGEIPLTSKPGYCYETISTAWHILKDFIIPIIRKKNLDENSINGWISELNQSLRGIRGHNFAKSGLDFCFYDLKAKLQNQSLPRILNASKDKIPTGISIGIQKSKEDLLEKIQNALAQNYQRIKIKIDRDNDIDLIKHIRKELGDFPLMVDANSEYTLADKHILLKLDRFDLLMIEQPLSHDDIVDHAVIQKELNTPICLDESIHNTDDTRKAISLESCKIINIKAARVGGLSESIKIANYCYDNKIDVWCGGMLESGIGRIMNIALQANEKFTYPGDTSASKRYFQEDIIDPEVKINTDGTIKVNQSYQILEDRIDKYAQKKEFLQLT
ncbi:MAG: o-succinylbenzoate synthase [Candidatus Hodarchaeales archaeon]